MTRSPVARLLELLSAHRRWVAAGVLLGFLAIAANVALVAMSAFLVSGAAVVDNVAELALAVTAVRVLAIGRAAFRYFERYATHVATLRILADVRVWFYAAIEPLAPARLTTRRSGDLLARIVADVETLEDFYVRVLVPPIVAILVTAFGCVLLGVFDVSLGLVLLAFLVLVGVVLPLLTRWLSREVSEQSIRTRGELSASIVDEVHGLADLIALDRADGHRATLLALGTRLDRTGERQALFRGLSVGLAALLTSLCAIAILALSIPLVVGGTLDGVYLALLPLAAVAVFEAVQPLSLSIQLLGASRAAAGRLFEVVDAPPPLPSPSHPWRRRRPGPRSRAWPWTFGASSSGTSQAAGRSWTTSASRFRPAAAWRSSARAARASPRSSTSGSGSGTTRRGRSSSAVATFASCGPTTHGACSGSCPSGSTCSTRRSGTTWPWPTRT